MKRKLLSLALALCLALTLLPTAALAEDEIVTEPPVEESTENSLPTEDPADPADVVLDPADAVDPVESSDPVDSADPVESPDPASEPAPVEAAAVARIGDETYPSLAEAIEAAGDEAEITLLSDCEGAGIMLRAGEKNLTIDFNRHTYTVSSLVGSSNTENQAVHLEKGNTVVLKNGEITVAENIQSGARMLIQNYCNLTAENMILDGSVLQYNDPYVFSNNDGEIMIKNCKITAPEGCVAVDAAIWGAYTGAAVTIEGGEVRGDLEIAQWSNEGGWHQVEGFEATPDGRPILKIKSGAFTDLNDAILCAENDAVITLAASVTEDVVIPAEQTITLDLNGMTLTNQSGHTITNNGTLTVTGTGTVDNVTHAKAALYNNGTLVLKDCTLTRSAEAGSAPDNNGGNSWYVLYNKGDMTINGSTIVSRSKYSSLIYNAKTAVIENGTFTNGFSVVNNVDTLGNLTVKGGVFTSTDSQTAIYNWAALKLEGGTLNAAGGKGVWAVADGCDSTTEISGDVVVNAASAVYAENYMDGTKTPPNTNGKTNTHTVSVTIKGGTLTGDVYAGRLATVTIEGGKFAGSLIKGTRAEATGTVAISGGHFTADPTDFVADDYVATSSDETGYAYTVKPKDEVDTVVKPAVETPKVEIPAGAEIPAESKDAVKTAAESVEAPAIAVAAAEQAKKLSAATIAAAADKLSAPDSGVTVTPETDTVTVFVQTRLDIQPTGYDPATKAMTLEIAPVYQLVASTADRAEDINLTGEGGAKNAVAVGKAESLTVTTPVTIAVPLVDFTATPGADYYVKHVKDGGKTYYYKLAIADGKATFTNPNGFSEFTLPVTDVAAQVGEVYYDSLQAAVNDVPSNGTILLMKDNAETVTVSRSVKFTLDRNGQSFTGEIKAGSGYKMSVAGNVYTFTRTGGGGGGSSSSSSYAVTLPGKTAGGSVTASPKSAGKGDTVTLTVKADDGYVLDELTVTDKDGKAVKLTEKSGGRFTFTMPASKVEVEVSFIPGSWENPFTDVEEDDWFFDGVEYVVENGMMNGLTAASFNPHGTTTRAMIVTILYRLEGEPNVSGTAFSDVADGKYYAAAVAWANANGIVTGYADGAFRPDQAITREQLAAILYRYAALKGYDVSAKADLSAFPDAGSVSSFAADALAWANSVKLVNGTADGKLAPAGSAERCQVAVILQRFCENIAK